MTRTWKGVFGSIALAVGLAATPGSAQEGDFLGSRSVGDFSDGDVIQVASAQLYQAVRLCVAQRSVHFQDVEVHFLNGGQRDADVRLLVNPGECTRWIDLPGQRRHIARIAMRYDMLVNAGGQAVVSAYGR